MRGEAETLSAGNVLLESGQYLVCAAPAAEIPNTLREIGRLREIAFRKAGEGTGSSLDIDRFDKHYRHLWVWNREKAEVCGAYRLAGTETTFGLVHKDPVSLPSRPAGATASRARNWAGPSCGPSIRRATWRCCCSGKASGGM